MPKTNRLEATKNAILNYLSADLNVSDFDGTKRDVNGKLMDGHTLMHKLINRFGDSQVIYSAIQWAVEDLIDNGKIVA